MHACESMDGLVAVGSSIYSDPYSCVPCPHWLAGRLASAACIIRWSKLIKSQRTHALYILLLGCDPDRLLAWIFVRSCHMHACMHATIIIIYTNKHTHIHKWYVGKVLSFFFENRKSPFFWDEWYGIIIIYLLVLLSFRACLLHQGRRHAFASRGPEHACCKKFNLQQFNKPGQARRPCLPGRLPLRLNGKPAQLEAAGPVLLKGL